MMTLAEALRVQATPPNVADEVTWRTVQAEKLAAQSLDRLQEQIDFDESWTPDWSGWSEELREANQVTTAVYMTMLREELARRANPSTPRADHAEPDA